MYDDYIDTDNGRDNGRDNNNNNNDDISERPRRQELGRDVQHVRARLRGRPSRGVPER